MVTSMVHSEVKMRMLTCEGEATPSREVYQWATGGES